MRRAVRLDGPCACATVDGAVNAKVFLAYVTLVLAPQLRPGDVVVLDNLSAHKASGVADAINAAGARVMYLPPYSPDLNPSENAFSKIKSRLKYLGARTVESLGHAVETAVASVTRSDAFGFFRHCGDVTTTS